MSGNSDREREDRAFEALIITQLLRERDITDLEDLPPLDESQQAAMEAFPADVIDSMWEEDADAIVDEVDCPPVCEEAIGEEQYVGMNRAEEMDEATKNELDEARKEVIKMMRKERTKGKVDADS